MSANAATLLPYSSICTHQYTSSVIPSLTPHGQLHSRHCRLGQRIRSTIARRPKLPTIVDRLKLFPELVDYHALSGQNGGEVERIEHGDDEWSLVGLSEARTNTLGLAIVGIEVDLAAPM